MIMFAYIEIMIVYHEYLPTYFWNNMNSTEKLHLCRSLQTEMPPNNRFTFITLFFNH